MGVAKGVLAVKSHKAAYLIVQTISDLSSRGRSSRGSVPAARATVISREADSIVVPVGQGLSSVSRAVGGVIATGHPTHAFYARS